MNKKLKTARIKLADLHIQAMLFDLEVDIERWTLRPKTDYKEPFWITRWKDKLNDSDYMTDGSDDQGWE